LLTSPSIPLLIKEREARDRMKFCFFLIHIVKVVGTDADMA
jgi:hypothetical protein